MKASELKPGMFVDLEKDKFADPNHDDLFKYEYSIVQFVDKDRVDLNDAVVVCFDTVEVVFPPDHDLVVFYPKEN